ncbi:MAG: PQQ-binding-like beta-propeller repeat protein [Planctomycetota bacterium]|jgi:hypothetical protein
MRRFAPILLLAFLFCAAPSRAGEGRPSTPLFLRNTELSAFLEERFDGLASGKNPGAFYRAVQSVFEADDEGLVRAGEDRFLRSPLFVRERIGLLHGPALEGWRAFAEPEARGLLAREPSRTPEASLARIVRRFPNTPAALECALPLLDLRIERGDFLGAADLLEDALLWTGPETLRTRLARRARFVRSRLGTAPPREERLFHRDSRDARQLASAFNRPLGQVRWNARGFPDGTVLRPLPHPEVLIGLSPHRAVVVGLRNDGSPAPPASVWAFAATILEGSCVGRTIYLTSMPEASPWRLPSGRRQKPSNQLFAIEPLRRGLLWEVFPERITGHEPAHAVFASGVTCHGGDLVAVTTRRVRGGARASYLLGLDPETGDPRWETFLFIRTDPPDAGRSAPGRRPRWTLLPAAGGLFASDGRGILLFVRDGSVQWVRTYEPIPPRDPVAPGGAPVLASVGNRLLAAPRDALRLYALRARDGALLASRAHPPVRKLEPGEAGSVWVEGEGQVVRVHVGDPDLRLRTKRAVPLESGGEGFAFGSLYAVPRSGRLLLIGSSGRYLRNLISPGGRASFCIRDGILYRLRIDSLSAFRIPETRAETALGTLPYVLEAPPDKGTILLLHWLESGDPILRRWASDLLRRITGRDFDFDPDGSAEERRRAVRVIREALGE